MNLVIEEGDRYRFKTGKACGIDLGLKTLATLSDGKELNRENLTKKYEVKLAVAQRAKKKKQIKAIHAKIANKREDWNHKNTTELVQQYDKIYIGNISSSKLKKTRMAKSVSDAGWSSFKSMPPGGPVEYKAIRLGVEVKSDRRSGGQRIFLNGNMFAVWRAKRPERVKPIGTGPPGGKKLDMFELPYFPPQGCKFGPPMWLQ